jgi:hypothetical protein
VHEDDDEKRPKVSVVGWIATHRLGVGIPNIASTVSASSTDESDVDDEGLALEATSRCAEIPCALATTPGAFSRPKVISFADPSSADEGTDMDTRVKMVVTKAVVFGTLLLPIWLGVDD